MYKIVLAIIFLFIRNITIAQNRDTLQVPKLDTQIQFDGLPFENEWEKIEPLPLVMFSPKYRGEMTENTEIRIAYDDDFFYVSGRFYDSDPDGIQGNTLIRDRNTGGDFLNVCIDSFNDNETYWYFGTMPSGVRIDAEIANDGEAPGVFNQDWNSFWSVKTVVADSGWFAEMRIPFSSLRFKKDSEEVVFGFSTNRLVGRKFERQVYPDISPDLPAAVWRASQGAKIKFSGITQKRPFYITPYLLGGFTRENTFSDIENNVENDDRWRREIGGDIKIGLSSNYTLDLTVNTDFAQVEADNFQANLTRFSLFFPEKRQFFQERAGIFSFNTSGFNRLFHSRVIGLTIDGRPEQVYGGVRLIGRSKGQDLGFLSMQTDAPDSLGTFNFSIFRMRQRVLNKYSYVGGIGLSKIDGEGNTNFTYGLDAILRLFGRNYMILKGGQSFSSDEQNGYFLYGKWEKRGFKGLGYSFEVDKTDNNFQPELGFILRRNLLLKQDLSYGFFPEESKKFRSVTPSASNSVYLRNGDGSLETLQTTANLNTTFLSGETVNIGFERVYDEVGNPFSISDEVTVDSGNYSFNKLQLGFGTNVDRRFRMYVSSELGSFYNGDNYIISFSPSWNISKHLELQASYSYNAIDFPSEQIRADVGIFRALVAMNLHWSLSSLIQYNKLNEKFGTNIRLRYNHSEGRDLYIVFNHLNNLETVNGSGDLLPEVESWSFLVKYTHAINLTK